MAITKILYINENKDWTPKHLKTSLNYITVPEKTDEGRYVGAINCQPDYAFEQMIETKKLFAKEDKRQAYHIMISFEESDISPDTVFEFMKRFADEYLKGQYEAVYAVHTNTDHPHAHLVFNSVNKMTGNKYRYEKGDWQKYIQPITNRLCEEYGFSTVSLEGDLKREKDSDLGLTDVRGNKLVWSDMIRRDIDAAIIRAVGYDDFLRILEDKGYAIKQGKYLSLRPRGMTRFRRTQTLGERYSVDSIKERIVTETLRSYDGREPEVIRVKIPYYLKRAKLSGMQKRYFKRLYETGKLKRKPYSEAWRYREDIKLFHKLQAQYLFLAKYEIHTEDDLKNIGPKLEEKRAESNREKGRIYKQRARFKPLFEIADRLDDLTPAEKSYKRGDDFFEDEHKEYMMLEKELADQGYTVEDVKELKEHYKILLSQYRDKYKGLNADLRILRSLINEELAKAKEPERTKTKENTLTRQP